MLVLTRKLNEKIRIGSSVTITVVRMKGKAVRLGIEAPSDVSVLRGELAFELPEEDRAAAKDKAADSAAQQSGPPLSSSKKAQRAIAESRRTVANHWPVIRLNQSSR